MKLCWPLFGGQPIEILRSFAHEFEIGQIVRIVVCNFLFSLVYGVNWTKGNKNGTKDKIESKHVQVTARRDSSFVGPYMLSFGILS